MRRIAFFSDIHANLPALQAVLADIDTRDPDAVYCLGDLVGYGGFPNEVIDTVRDTGLSTIMGNYDEGVGHQSGDCGCFYPDERALKIGKASYDYTVTAVTDKNKAWLRELPRELHLEVEGRKLHLVHGSPRRINEYLLEERDARTYARLAAAETDDVLLFGHTHQIWQRRHGDVEFVNTGSVGRPKDGDPRAAYVVLEVGDSGVTALPVRVEYDTDAAAQAILTAGLPEALAEGVRHGR